MSQNILAKLRQQNFKITPSRQALVEIFQTQKNPLTVPELQTLLEKRFHLRVNKTTVYRELDFLLAQKIITAINFNDRLVRYESSDRPHHHHLVCTQCKRTEEVEVDHQLHKVELQLEKSTKFKIIQHSLEFFGLCALCNKQGM